MRLLWCLTQKSKVLCSLLCLAVLTTGAAVFAAPLVFEREGEPAVSVLMEENPTPDRDGKTLWATIIGDEEAKYYGDAIIGDAGYFEQLHGYMKFIFEYKNGRFKLIKSNHVKEDKNEADQLEKDLDENQRVPYTNRYRGQNLVEYCSADKTKYVLFVSQAPEVKKGLKRQEEMYSYTLVYMADGKEQNRFYLPEFNVAFSLLDRYMYCDEKTQILYGQVYACTPANCDLGGLRALDLKTGRITPFLSTDAGSNFLGLNNERVMLYWQGEKKDNKFYTYFYSKPLLEKTTAIQQDADLTIKEKETTP